MVALQSSVTVAPDRWFLVGAMQASLAASPGDGAKKDHDEKGWTLVIARAQLARAE